MTFVLDRFETNEDANEDTPSDEHATEQDVINIDDHHQDNDNGAYSKESRVSKVYRTLVYHPFNKAVCMSQYGLSGKGEVPDHLTAVSWIDGIDGTHGQLKSIASEKNLDKETLKIKSGKHSNARTGVEQFANLFLNFKLKKKDFKPWRLPIRT